MSSWPLYFAQGEYTSAVDGKQREIGSYMPITVTTQDRSLLIGGPSEEPELYDLAADPGETTDIWSSREPDDERLLVDALAYLEECGTPPEFLAPRRRSLSLSP